MTIISYFFNALKLKGRVNLKAKKILLICCSVSKNLPIESSPMQKHIKPTESQLLSSFSGLPCLTVFSQACWPHCPNNWNTIRRAFDVWQTATLALKVCCWLILMTLMLVVFFFSTETSSHGHLKVPTTTENAEHLLHQVSSQVAFF